MKIVCDAHAFTADMAPLPTHCCGSYLALQIFHSIKHLSQLHRGLDELPGHLHQVNQVICL
jgi:hypothetical protein